MRLPSDQRNNRVNRQRDMRALSRLALLLFSGAVLAGGFVFAAKQHFAAVSYGYTSEQLRKEREQLLRENQQLSLEREQAASPVRLEAAARALGLKPLQARQVGAAVQAVAKTKNVSRAQTALQQQRAKTKVVTPKRR
jgi:cell division protein FtsL